MSGPDDSRKARVEKREAPKSLEAQAIEQVERYLKANKVAPTMQAKSRRGALSLMAIQTVQQVYQYALRDHHVGLPRTRLIWHFTQAGVSQETAEKIVDEEIIK